MMDSLAGHHGGRAEEQLKQERRDQREVHHAHGGMIPAMPGRPLPLLVEWTAVRGLSEPALVRASAATPARRSPGRSVVKCPVAHLRALWSGKLHARGVRVVSYSMRSVVKCPVAHMRALWSGRAGGST